MMRVFRIPVRPVGRWAALPAAHGRAARALLYGWLERGDPELARLMHEEKGGAPKPYACSLLLGAGEPQEGAHLLTASRLYSLEVCALTQRASEAVARGLPAAGDVVQLKRTALEVAGPIQELRQASYRRIWETAPARHWRFRFLSPVMIELERSKSPLMLPVPRFLFSNLVQKWNAFAPEEDEALPAFPPGGTLAWVEEHVQVVWVSGLRTVDLSGGEEGPRGFVGEAEFEVTGAPDLQHVVHCRRFGNARDGVERPRIASGGGAACDGDSRHSVEPWRMASALARLAAFAGVGGRTLEGAGRVEVTE